MVKVNFPSEVAKEYIQLITGTMEDALKTVKSHDSLVREKKLTDKLQTNGELIAFKTEELKHVRKQRPTSAKLDELISEITELKGRRQELKDAPFNLLGQMCGDDLQTKWEAIVARECESSDYIDLDGQKRTEPRGRTMKGLQACYVKFLRLFGPEDSAERLKDYLLHHVTLNFHTVTVEQGVFRMQELNGYLKWLPSLRNIEGSPKEMVRIKPLAGFELCSLIKHALPRGLRASYETVTKARFESDIDALRKQLFNCQEDMATKQAEVKAIVHGMGLGDRIPKKDRRNNTQSNNKKQSGGGSAGAGNRKPAGTRKECERCAKWKPNSMAKTTHWTKDCKTFNADGSRKKPEMRKAREDGEVADGSRYRGRYNNRISRADQDEIRDYKRELKRERARSKKWAKRAHKLNKRSRRRGGKSYDFSSDSDSDSGSSMSE